MKMYTSTRSQLSGVSATEAILKGISEDGGLFVPMGIPKMDFKLNDLVGKSYQEVAYQVMKLFFGELSEEGLKKCIQAAYDSKFDTQVIAPVACTEKSNFLELFHGPTLAFKDMALTILPHLMLESKAAQKEENEIVILTATSGDTGKAALEGFAKVEGTRIIVFFPEDGVSEVQKRQMVTTDGDNTCVVGIHGNFDDAQTGVKMLLGDQELSAYIQEKGYKFSSANSINIGRLVPQVVYYFYAYMQMVAHNKLTIGEPMNVVVPTGNFGNILAAYYAKNMGLPIQKLICASNKNKVLFDFFKEGVYNRDRAFYTTNSPSMDILISSNLERLLYHISGENPDVVKGLMESLKQTGVYSIPESMQKALEDFYGGYADDEMTKHYIKKVFEEQGYLMDTHTAVAYAVYDTYQQETGDSTATVIVSTASPYKFSGSVMSSLDEKYETEDDFELLYKIQDILKEEMPEGIKGLFNQEIRHTKQCNVDEMQSVVKEFLN